MRTLLTLLMLLGASSLGSAQEPQESAEVMVWGAGATSCGEFLKVTETHPRNEAVFGQWLHGYLTAFNVTNKRVVDHAAGIDRPGLMAWITKYCKDKPLDTFFEATQALVQHLEEDGRTRTKSTN